MQLLVTGGANKFDDRLDTTEVLEAGTYYWILTAPLPSARYGLRAAVLDNKIFLFGETILCYINIEHLIVTYNVYNDDIFKGGKYGGSALKDILQYNTASHTWEEVGQMKKARGFHAVALLDDVSQLCP